MYKKSLGLIFLISCLACSTEKNDKSKADSTGTTSQMVFDKSRWNVSEGLDYPFRDRMVNDVVYNDTIRDLSKNEILDLLGEPDRINENYLYYLVDQKRIGNWPLHTKTMVIKLTGDSIEWIKIHQ